MIKQIFQQKVRVTEEYVKLFKIMKKPEYKEIDGKVYRLGKMPKIAKMNIFQLKKILKRADKNKDIYLSKGIKEEVLKRISRVHVSKIVKPIVQEATNNISGYTSEGLKQD